MNRKLSVGLIVGALLLSGLIVGVSWGGTAKIDAPEVIELREAKVLGQDGRQVKKQLKDADGAEVGTIVWDCTNNDVAWVCTNVLSLRAGASTQPGTVVVSGIFRGFNGERLAVTGGTGAYSNVRGYVVLTVEDHRYTHTLHLTP